MRPPRDSAESVCQTTELAAAAAARIAPRDWETSVTGSVHASRGLPLIADDPLYGRRDAAQDGPRDGSGGPLRRRTPGPHHQRPLPTGRGAGRDRQSAGRAGPCRRRTPGPHHRHRPRAGQGTGGNRQGPHRAAHSLTPGCVAQELGQLRRRLRVSPVGRIPADLLQMSSDITAEDS